MLNEKVPSSNRKIKVPKPIKGSIVTDAVKDLRGHPDTERLRRAATIARLAQVINERKVQPGLRKDVEDSSRAPPLVS